MIVGIFILKTIAEKSENSQADPFLKVYYKVKTSSLQTSNSYRTCKKWSAKTGSSFHSNNLIEICNPLWFFYKVDTHCFQDVSLSDVKCLGHSISFKKNHTHHFMCTFF